MTTTPEEFRANPDLRIAFRNAMLSNPIFGEVLKIVQHSALPRKSISYGSSDPMLSVAMTHAHQAGVQDAVRMIMTMMTLPESSSTGTQEYGHITPDNVEENLLLQSIEP